MWVRIVSGRSAGVVTDLPRTEAENLLASGFAVRAESPEAIVTQPLVVGPSALAPAVDSPPAAPEALAPEAKPLKAGMLVVRHIGGGVYELPNGERVRGKDEAKSAGAALLKSRR